MAFHVSTCVRILGGVSLIGLASGCYSRRSADEDDVFGVPPHVLSSADAGTTGDTGSADTGSGDAGSASRCTGTDAIALLLCNLTNPAPGGTSTNGLSDLTKLLDSAGGLASIASVLGAFTGTTPTTPTTQPSLIDLINLAGGLNNIATLLNGLLGGTTTARPAASSPIADLIAAFAQSTTAANAPPAMSSAPPTLVDWLNGLGLARTAGSAAATPMVAAPSAAQCAAPTDPITQFFCQLESARAGTSLAQ